MALYQKPEEERSRLVSTAWSAISHGYDRDLVPRFKPWQDTTLALLSRQALPPGTIFVPACGPGQELEPLAAAFPGNRVFGADLAADMISRAQERIAASPTSARLAAEVANCSAVPEHLRPLAGVFSCFGLQQMPNPSASLLDWYQALQPGGVAAVTYWPASVRQTEEAWVALTDTVVMKDQATAPAPVDWEADIPGAAVRAGALLLADTLQTFPMTVDSAAHFFEVMVHSGPLQLRLLALGPEKIEAQKAAFVSRFGGRQPFVVRPCARTVLLQKPKEARL